MITCRSEKRLMQRCLFSRVPTMRRIHNLTRKPPAGFGKTNILSDALFLSALFQENPDCCRNCAAAGGGAIELLCRRARAISGFGCLSRSTEIFSINDCRENGGAENRATLKLPAALR